MTGPVIYNYTIILYTVKKGKRFSRPPAGMSLIKLSLAAKNLIFPARESLVSDIPAGDGKIANLFLQCRPQKVTL
jgi:hypothetical protein